MMSQSLTSSAALIAVGETFMPCIALLLMHGQFMIILGLPHSCWRESREEKAADGEHTVCAERRACTAPSCQGCSENCQNVWHTDLCVGKRQGGGEETLSFQTYQPPGLSRAQRWPNKSIRMPDLKLTSEWGTGLGAMSSSRCVRSP